MATHRTPQRALLLAFLLAALAGGASLGAADWPQWRGPNRDGKSAESGLATGWPEAGPARLWTANDAGRGYSSFAIVGNRLFTMGLRADDKSYIIAYDTASGAEVWATAIDDGYDNNRGDGPRGTPTVDGEWLYAEGATGKLVCLNVATGRPRWSIDLLKTFDARNIGWGLSESPLVVDKALIVTPGGSEASVVALDKEDASVIWKTPGARAGYASPILTSAGGVRQVVIFNSRNAVGLRLEDGKELWDYDKASNQTANCTTPIVRGDHVFVTSDYGTGCALLEIEKEDDGLRANEVYFNQDMKNHHGGVVLVEDHLYGFSSSILTCLEFESGERKWRDRSVGKGAVIYADGHLYCLGENGVVGLVEATPEGYREKGRFELGGSDKPTWAHPAIADGRLYLRKDDEIRCYDIRRTTTAEPAGS